MGKIAVLFRDLPKFTQIREEQSPQKVVSYLNAYYSIMSDPIKKYNGFVNQHLGDKIFTIFGTSAILPNPEQSAFLCIVVMGEKVQINNL